MLRVTLLSWPMLVALACACRSSPQASADAAPADAKPIAAARPRVSMPGESPLALAPSQLSLTMIKDRVAPVTATLRLRDGAIALDAKPPSARLSVDLDTFDSSIAIRDERVRNIFFETSAIGWESGEIVIPSIPRPAIDQLRRDKHAHAELEGTLKLHDHVSKLTMSVDVDDKGGGRVGVKTTAPVQVKISEVGLTDNLRRLSAICMHDSIDDVVKIDASLEFSPP